MEIIVACVVSFVATALLGGKVILPALRRLKERPAVKEVELRPLMTVAGDHAKNDLAGEEEDSWKNILEGMGYRVSCVLTGLGEYPQVRALFVDHARKTQA